MIYQNDKKENTQQQWWLRLTFKSHIFDLNMTRID